jgi:hypothetical protein
VYRRINLLRTVFMYGIQPIQPRLNYWAQGESLVDGCTLLSIGDFAPDRASSALAGAATKSQQERLAIYPDST